VVGVATVALFGGMVVLGLAMAVVTRMRPTPHQLRQQFFAQWQSMSPCGRVLYPLCILGLLAGAGILMGRIELSARGGMA